jgi:hypothetical protein
MAGLVKEGTKAAVEPSAKRATKKKLAFVMGTGGRVLVQRDVNIM